MASFLDVCRFMPTAGGTTDWTYSSVVTGYQSPTAAGAVNGAIYRYRAESADLSQWEIGFGVWNSSTGVLSRGTVTANSAGTTAKINFSTTPQVAVVALSADLTRVNQQPGGRLTLSSGVAVMTTDVAAATSLYYAPSATPYVPIFNGSDVLPYQFTSSATDTVGLTLVLGASWAASTLFDVFVTLISGVPTLVTGPAWASSAAGTSSRGYSLALMGGILTNAASMTVQVNNSTTATMPVNEGTYVGTIRTNGTAGQIDFKFGSAAAGGGLAVAGIWNAYNREPGAFCVMDTNNAWNPTTVNTEEPFDNSTNNRIIFITGLANEPIEATISAVIATGATYTGQVGLALNNTTSFASRAPIFGVGSSAANQQSGGATGRLFGSVGLNYVQAMQSSTNSSTIYATGSPTNSALTAEWWW